MAELDLADFGDAALGHEPLGEGLEGVARGELVVLRETALGG